MQAENRWQARKGFRGGSKDNRNGSCVHCHPCEQRDLLPRCVPQSQTDLTESEGKCLCVLIIQSGKHLRRQECAPEAGHPGKEGQGQAAPPPHRGTESRTPTQGQSHASTHSHTHPRMCCCTCRLTQAYIQSLPCTHTVTHAHTRMGSPACRATQDTYSHTHAEAQTHVQVDGSTYAVTNALSHRHSQHPSTYTATQMLAHQNNPTKTTLVLEAGARCSPELWLRSDGMWPILRRHRYGPQHGTELQPHSAQIWPEP